jgi:CO dehydrogenase/acetyl-CoA synthase gamma subunit (corrinoid Fe-S protein)
MSRFDKISEALESAESIELRIYRDKVKDSLRKELVAKRDEMLKEDRYPFIGRWLTLDEIALAMENEKKEKFTRLVLVIMIYALLLIVSIVLGFVVWRATG